MSNTDRDEAETPIDRSVIERTAEDSPVSEDDLAEALVVLDAELLGRHSAYEAEYEYATVGDRRAYLLDEAAWDDLAGSFDLDDDLLAAARSAHTEQARLLFDEAVESHYAEEATVGVVVGIDTAEQMT